MGLSPPLTPALLGPGSTDNCGISDSPATSSWAQDHVSGGWFDKPAVSDIQVKADNDLVFAARQQAIVVKFDSNGPDIGCGEICSQFVCKFSCTAILTIRVKQGICPFPVRPVNFPHKFFRDSDRFLR